MDPQIVTIIIDAPNKSMNVSELIDQFVVFIDPNRTIFRKIESAPWIDALETKLPRRLPASFRSLVVRYAFRSFDAGDLHFFANTGDDSSDELTVAVFRDRFIANATLKSGYIQFARPEDGSYDPICFDARRSVSNREFPIVRLDHEAILCHDRIREVAPVAKSFYRFVADLVDRA
jgi:hypothetical protein